MKRKFVIGASALSLEQEKAFLAHLKSEGMGYWHWISGMWLVIDPKGRTPTKSLRDALVRIAPGHRILVMRIEGRTHWSGYRPSHMKKDMFRWVKEAWADPGSDDPNSEQTTSPEIQNS